KNNFILERRYLMEKWKFRLIFLLITASMALLTHCTESNLDSEKSGMADEYNMDTDAGDYNLNSDADTDSDSDADGPIDYTPEVEQRFDYRIPVSSGKYIFIPDKENDQIAAVNSRTLDITLAKTGASPTQAVPISNDGQVAVIAVDSDKVSLIRTDSTGALTATNFPVRPDTNALKASPSGRYVIAFYDSLFAEESLPPQTDQDITVIDTKPGKEAAYDMIIGIHPIKIVFNSEETLAFAITEEGVDIIDLENLNNNMMPDAISLFDYTVVDPGNTEIQIDPSGTVAIGRREDSPQLTVAWLDGSDEIRNYTLQTTATDLDIANDGSFGMITSRYGNQVAFFNLPFPSDSTTDPFTYVDLAGSIAGAAVISDDGAKAALYTTIGDTDRDVLTVLSKVGSTWTIDKTLLNRTVKGVIPSPDSSTFIVIHDQISAYATDSMNQAYSFSLVKLPDLKTKFQQMSMKETQILLTNDGTFAYLLFSDKSIDIINLQSFIVNTMELGSVPVAAGYTSDTDKIFISQDHPSGRMTFMDKDGTNVKTVTGYALNDSAEN
ncbi:MAG: hypothetical protein JXR91_16270, partial [Deltaproteobacteria bacterium]|nr:hypothetical protein [Deltaproteobacteria bacterium]